MFVREKARELVTERLGYRKKMDLCNLSLCVKYNLHIACIICFLLGQENTEIRGDILREEFYLCLLCMLLYHLD